MGSKESGVPENNGRTNISDEQWRDMARARYQSDGEIELDDEGMVSQSGEGAYVQAWLWVDRPDPGEASGAPRAVDEGLADSHQLRKWTLGWSDVTPLPPWYISRN